MITIIKHAQEILPLMAFGKKKDDSVDKGTNRETPGDSGGARPPKREEYKDSKGKKKKDSPEEKDSSKSK